MSPLLRDERLSLEARFRLRQVEAEAADCSVEQLRQCLLMAWHGWLLERERTAQILDAHGIEVTIRLRGYTPAEVVAAMTPQAES